MLVGIGLLGFASVGGWITVATPGYSSPANAATTAYVPDMDSLLDARSPGGRHYSGLVSTKPERIAYEPHDPIERVLSSIRRRPPTAAAPGALPSTSSPIFLDGVTVPFASTGDPTLPGDGSLAGGIGSLSGPAAVGGVLPSIGGGVGTPTPGQNLPLSAVPEPGVWNLMILGFGALGIVLRRRRAASLVFSQQ